MSYGVCVSVTFVNSDKANKHIFKIFSPSGSQAILVFQYQMTWQYSDGNPHSGGIECRWGRQKSRLWLHCMLSKLRTARCYQHAHRGAAGSRSCKLWPYQCSKRQSLLMAGDNDEMFMTRNINVAPKTTEQHLIARSDKSVAYVTNNKRLFDVLYWS